MNPNNMPPLVNFPAEQPSAANTQAAVRHSYLLRLWRSGTDGGWRASLQVIQSGERHMFADLESLLTFLREQ